MKKTTVNEYSVSVVSKETRSFCVNAASAHKAAELISSVVSQTDVIPIGKKSDCDVSIEISALGNAKDPATGKHDSCRLRLLRFPAPEEDGTEVCGGVITPEELFRMMSDEQKAHKGGNENEGR